MQKLTETNRVEFKKELTSDLDLEKEVIAFLNYNEGGVIYFGIDNSGDFVGVDDVDRDMLKIKDRIKNNILPSPLGLFDVVYEVMYNKDLIKIIIASGSEKPYYKKNYGLSEKGCFIRIGTTTEPMASSQIEKLFASRTRNSIGKIKSPKNDLKFEQLKIYYQETKKSLNEQFLKNLELLNENDKINYVGYLLSDNNNVSVKVAKYSNLSRVDLIESNEYGYCSIIKSTKSVLDKLILENKLTTQITSRERKDSYLWQPIAIREAVINAFVHNDYTTELAPKFEIFSDRIEITSYGGLQVGLNNNEFFEGYSVPRNKELMRIYRDLGLVEQLGSGIPRIIEYYSRDIFTFSDNFLRIIIPNYNSATPQAPPKYPLSTPQVLGFLKLFNGEHSRTELMCLMNLKDIKNFKKNYLNIAIDENYVELTIPDKPNSNLQKYRLTEKGMFIVNELK